MKILLQHVFAHKNPLYLLSTYLRLFTYPSYRYRTILRGLGKVKAELFKEGLYDGIEFDAHHVDIFFHKRWEIDKKRVARFKKQNLPIEAVHAHYPTGIRILKRSEILLNLAAIKSIKIINGLKAHIKLTAELVESKKILVVHPGIIKRGTESEAIENIVGNIKPCFEDLDKHNVVLCLENLNPLYRADIKTVGDEYTELAEILQRLNHPNVKVVYDFGHANSYARYNYARNKKSLPKDYLTNFTYHKELINTLGKDIVYAHLNYNPAHDPQETLLKKFMIAGWDYHMGLNRIPEKWRPGYKELIERLIKRTSIKEFGKVLLEIRPYRLFRIFDFSAFGVTDEEAVQTVTLLREWLKDFESENTV